MYVCKIIKKLNFFFTQFEIAIKVLSELVA